MSPNLSKESRKKYPIRIRAFTVLSDCFIKFISSKRINLCMAPVWLLVNNFKLKAESTIAYSYALQS